MFSMEPMEDDVIIIVETGDPDVLDIEAEVSFLVVVQEIPER